MNIVADIGNSQIKIAIERKNGISRVKAFRSDDFKNIMKYLKALDYDSKPYLFFIPLIPGFPIALNWIKLQFKMRNENRLDNFQGRRGSR